MSIFSLIKVHNFRNIRLVHFIQSFFGLIIKAQRIFYNKIDEYILFRYFNIAMTY